MANCWLCGQEALVAGVGPLDQDQAVNCPTCGRYTLDTSALNALQDIRSPLRPCRYLVSGHLREMGLRPGWRGAALPLTEDSLAAIVAAAPVEVTERIDRLLVNWATLGDHAGACHNIDEKADPALGYCRNYDELLFFVDQLRRQGLLEYKPGNGFRLTAEGWARVRDLRRNAVDTTQAFFAMWFSPEVQAAFDKGIEPGIRDAGYRALRIDNKEHSNRIDDEIIVEINRSRFLVAQKQVPRSRLHRQPSRRVLRGRLRARAGQACHLDGA
jgi:hypothetical protein